MIAEAIAAQAVRSILSLKPGDPDDREEFSNTALPATLRSDTVLDLLSRYADGGSTLDALRALSTTFKGGKEAQLQVFVDVAKAIVPTKATVIDGMAMAYSADAEGFKKSIEQIALPAIKGEIQRSTSDDLILMRCRKCGAPYHAAGADVPCPFCSE